MAATALAEFDHVVKDYPSGILRRSKLRAVDDVCLRIGRGEVLGLLGPNRAGKTTLVKLLLSLAAPTGGRITRLGVPAADRRTLGRIGYVHENHAFPRYLSAAALLHYYGALSLIPAEQVEQRVPKLLRRVGLADRAYEPIARFSKGMIQRLGIAQALINEPDLLVLDEPSEGLDMEGRQLICDIAFEQKKAGRSVLLISHVLPEVERICDRIVVLVNGKIVHTSLVSELTKNALNENYQPLEKALKRIYERSP